MFGDKEKYNFTHKQKTGRELKDRGCFRNTLHRAQKPILGSVNKLWVTSMEGCEREHPQGPVRRFHAVELATDRDEAWDWLACCFQTHPPAVYGRISPNSRKLRLWNPEFIGLELTCLCIWTLHKEYWYFHYMNPFVWKGTHSPEAHLYKAELCLAGGSFPPTPPHLGS